MTQTQTEQHKTIGKRRSFSAWLRRKVTPKGSVRKISPRSETTFTEPRAVFGVPLIESIQYARQTISYQDEDGTVYRQAGAIPTLVAKTGLYLKQNALQSEGIFRLSGSLKRVATLQEAFNKPSYGANVEWEDNTVHDVATLLRRFLNQLPDPVITHEYYQSFRDVMNDNAYDSIEERIDAFQVLIEKLPLPHQQLLLYILDMLNLFSRHSADNRMDACNLAAVFCPAILSHPSHNTPVQYKISQRVIEFLIEFQALFTMQMVNKNNKVDGFDSNNDDVPPVPVLPDWVGATYISQKTVPPLDMETVHHHTNGGGVHRQKDHSLPLDSGTDVKTPAPFHLKDNNDDNDDDNASTPRQVPSPPPGVNVTPASPIVDSPRSIHASADNNNTNKNTDSPIGVLMQQWYKEYCEAGYGGYQALTFRNLINGIVFFGGLSLYGMMIMQGVNKRAEKKPSAAVTMDSDDNGCEDHIEDLTTETLIEQDRATEEAMFKDESLMAVWGDLMNRSWRTDPATPSIMRRNSSSDSYFNREQDTDEEIDQASMLSISSRFNEEQNNNSSDDDNYDDDDDDWTPPDLAEEELQRLWYQFQQVEKDKDLAEKLQQEENAAEQKRDEATNPFLATSPPISPLNTEQESWKIVARPQKQ
ncbi:hypothetical protein INT45_008419 [Circinella minor]|uniref:Rho-GAP domain-containing protein n=1 Tax=Circinella minor TaxID=1195481 RepID=A0A8H7SEL9_9FUNG|nr:hypothetical protein INT45_008419 [Circinella minor]